MELPSTFLRERAFALSKRISAIQILPNEDGDRTRLGLITQLPEGAEIEVRGPGFSDRTVRVRCAGSSYFVFIDDLGEMDTRTVAAHG